MKMFEYGDEKPTIESAIHQGVGMGSGCWQNLNQAGLFDEVMATAIAAALISEVRGILHTDLVRLLDPEGTASEWNLAIEQAIRAVEGQP